LTTVPVSPLVGKSVRLAFTMKLAVWFSRSRVSVATTGSGPFEAAGTVNEQLKTPPVCGTISQGDGVVTTDAPLKVMVTVAGSCRLGSKPVPLAVTVDPTGPLVGERVRVWVASGEKCEDAVPALPEPPIAVKPKTAGSGSGGPAFGPAGIARPNRAAGKRACPDSALGGSDRTVAADPGPFSALPTADPDAAKLEITTSSVAAATIRTAGRNAGDRIGDFMES
jgi:hypothetical protein